TRIVRVRWRFGTERKRSGREKRTKEVNLPEVRKGKKKGAKERTEEIKSNHVIVTLVNTAQSFGWYSRTGFVSWSVLDLLFVRCSFFSTQPKEEKFPKYKKTKISLPQKISPNNSRPDTQP